MKSMSFTRDNTLMRVIDRVIYETNPKLVLRGHLHILPCTIYRYEYGTLYVWIDSSQKHRAYLVLYTGSRKAGGLEGSGGPSVTRFIEN